jgi:hypothetical protein
LPTKARYPESRRQVGKKGRSIREPNMSLNDPIADMLTRVRNAARIMSKQVNIKASKVCVAIAAVLKTEGYI